jgi:Fe-S cluster assembly ATP-binding protein
VIDDLPISIGKSAFERMATPLGFEPRITPPKGAVLPLHHGVSRFRILDWRFWIKSQSAKSDGRNSLGPNDGSQIPETSLYFLFAVVKELSVENLHVTIADKEIVRGLSLRVPRGEVHALMGPNGSGKSTLAKVLAGHPDYQVTKGKVMMDGENLLELDPDERARRGLFLAFQYPSEVPGVTIANFLRAAMQSRLPEGEELEATDYYAKLYEKMELLGMDRSFTSRAVNEGFSGGEKKRTEILQLAMLDPKYAILDETDSGLDIDALKTVAHGVNSLRGPDLGVLLITHYQRLLNYIVPDYVHVMVAGRIVRSGRKELALELEERGYDWAREEAAELVLR